tara:strand:+ start:3310 stop:3723 length:414 start_codon:yes stop_codon:yes gene_type:complete
MNKIATILRALTGGINTAIKTGGGLDAIASIVDEYKLTDQEIMEEEQSYEVQLTERLKADMSSDNWLSKSVRPIGFMVWTVLILIMIFLDGNLGTFSIREGYLPLIETVYISYVSFYIGSRGVEKSLRVWSKTKDKS